MNVLFNVPYGLFEASVQKNYTGPLHFSSMLVQSFNHSKHRFTAVVFEKTPPQPKPTFNAKVVKQGKNQWLVLKIWVPTGLIVDSKRRMSPEVRMILDQVKAVLMEAKPDIYFVNGFSALTFLILEAAHELNIPIVTTHHGIWYKEYIVLRKDLIKSPIKYRIELENDTVRYATKNIFLSGLSLREYNKHLMKVPAKQIESIKIPYNPVFLNKTYPAVSKSKEIVILMVGRWDAVKNHEAYLALSKRAREKGLPWTFRTVATIGDYPHYNAIKDEYSKYIEVIPAMAAKDLKKEYQKASLIVVPSHFDVYPGVVTESILQNRPALISKNVGWVDDYKKHGISHWITDFSNPDKAIAKIKRVSQEQVPKSLYKEVLTLNNPDYVFKKYYQLFEKVVKQTKKAV